MNSSDFQKWTQSTSIYLQSPACANSKLTAHAYEVLGLVSEVSEFALASSKEDIIKEAGDIMWYLARICTFYGIDLGEIARVVSDVNKGEYEGNRTSPNLRNLPFEHVSMLSDMAKKFIRDWDGTDVSFQSTLDRNRARVKVFVGSTVIDILPAVGISGRPQDVLSQLYMKNVEKLESRKDRNVLHGSGDNR